MDSDIWRRIAFRRAPVAGAVSSETVGEAILSRLVARLFAPIDIAPLVYFRIAFGSVMLWEVWRYLDYGRISRYYIDPVFHFTYYGFDWVKPLPGDLMYAHFYLLGTLSVMIIAGLFYRLAAALFFLGFTYIFLIDQTNWLNHFYLIMLISFIMVLIPANRALSLDAWRVPRLRNDTAPAWTRYLILAQIGIAWFYGGIAKINGDWLRGQPMHIWLTDRTDFPIFGPWFDEVWMAYLFSYGGLLIDLLVPPLLLWERTRLPAFLIGVAFHIANNELFSIGIFPWFMIAGMFLFFPPQTFRVRGLFGNAKIAEDAAHAAALTTNRLAVVFFLSVYLAFQLLFPLRHYLYPGQVSWTEEGHRFSWHMKLRDKASNAFFTVTEPETGATWEVDANTYLTPRQYDEMSSRPDMILQFAHFLRDNWRKRGYDNVEVRAEVLSSLNGREYQFLIDPDVDLAKERRSLGHANWIVPLTEPFSPIED